MLDPKDVKPGQEQHEGFETAGGRVKVQYDYRSAWGELFTTVGDSLTDCRAKRDVWLRQNPCGQPTGVGDFLSTPEYSRGPWKVHTGGVLRVFPKQGGITDVVCTVHQPSDFGSEVNGLAPTDPTALANAALIAAAPDLYKIVVQALETGALPEGLVGQAEAVVALLNEQFNAARKLREHNAKR